MLQDFLATHRSELLDRWRARVHTRVAPPESPTAGPHLGDIVDFERVVRDYSDLCQSILELAGKRDAPGSVEELVVLTARLDQGHDERLRELVGLLRNLLATTVVAVAAIKGGHVGFNGATGAALDRSLLGMREVIDRVLRELACTESSLEEIEVGTFILDAQVDATLAGAGTDNVLTVAPVEAGLHVEADRRALACVVRGLLRDALAAESGTEVVLRAHGREGRVLIEVEGDCWGETFHWRNESDPEIARARQRVVADGGRFQVRAGAFTIDLPMKA